MDSQDPGNVGAIVRSAEAGGASGVQFTGSSADPWGWKALRAAMGSTFRVPVLRQPDSAVALAHLRDAGLALLATVPRDGTPMLDVDMRGPLTLILGGEGRGLDQTTMDAADQRVSIPMSGEVESLNVAVAAGLLVYEARRQRGL
jgi:TrmH family RNA methyltransferase